MNEKASNRIHQEGIGKVVGRQRVTMQDIARAAGCSQPTVSIVLNGNDAIKISDTTKARVLKAAEQLGYRATGTIRPSLERTSTENLHVGGPIAFIVDNLATSPESANAFDGIMQAVKSTGNVVLLAETQNDPVHEPKTISYFLDQGVAAIIYACVFTRKVTVPDLLRNTEIPVFLLNCYSDDLSIPSVIPGEIAGGHTATNALIRAGHTRIGVITGELHMECASGRLQGYRNALANADLPFAEELVVHGDWLPSSGYRGTQQLLSLSNPPTAIFCQNDRMAIGCYEALKENGLSIAKDMSVIGFDDDEVARHLSPPLTSLNLGSRAMGRWVIEQLFHGPVGQNQRHPLTKLECELVERDSIGPPKKNNNY
ncbi:MAG: LacI family DNA-binding transcriptional regulator [Pseudomonadota bacterium]